MKLDNLVVSDRKETLYNDIVNFLPDDVHVDSCFLHLARQLADSPLEPSLLDQGTTVLTLLVCLAHCVIGQVTEPAALIEVVRRVAFRCESDQAVTVQVDSQRLVRCHDHVQPKVKLMPVQQQRIIDILLDNTDVLR